MTWWKIRAGSTTGGRSTLPNTDGVIHAVENTVDDFIIKLRKVNADTCRFIFAPTATSAVEGAMCQGWQCYKWKRSNFKLSTTVGSA